MNNIKSLQEAENDIKPYLAVFKSCYEGAIIKYNRILAVYAEPMYNRTKAINFQNIIVNEIKSAFFSIDNTSIVEKYESISLIINNYISARFKKLNKQGLPNNHKSNRNDSIISQQLQLGFVDYPPLAWIDIGYALDISGMSFDILKVVCRKDGDIIWDLYFTDYEQQADIETNRVTVKEDTLEPNNDPSRVRVKIINQKDRKANEG
jgi:hypothetical protein